MSAGIGANKNNKVNKIIEFSNSGNIKVQMVRGKSLESSVGGIDGGLSFTNKSGRVTIAFPH
jgi:hypothetical protein